MVAQSPLAFAGAASVMQTRAVAPMMKAKAAGVDLAALADDQKIPMGFWDPLKLSEKDFWNQGNDATIGWLRHAEIKHGRVAMAAFVGFCVQSAGIHFPWDIANGVSYESLSQIPAPGDQWDAVPSSGKLQILFFVFLLEWIGEDLGDAHYMRGGKPGYYPSLKEASSVPHPVPLELFDPFDLFSKSVGDSEEKKARLRNVEINNGRGAMLGIFAFLSASKGLIVPGYDGLNIAPYTGEYMGFYGPNDALPLVQKMYEGPFPWTPTA